METRAHYVAVGGFVLAMIFIAVVGVIYFGAVAPTVSFAHYDIYFRGAVTGVSRGSVVDYNGIPVGKVSDVEIDPNNVEQIRVTVEIDSKVVIKTDAKASVEANLLSGVGTILISKGTQEAPVLTAKAGERYPVIQAHRSALANVYAHAPELLEKLNDIGDNLNALLSEENRKAVTQILANVNKVTGDVAAHDKDLTDLFANANTAVGSLGKLMGHVDQSYMAHDGIKDRLNRVLGDGDEAAKELRSTAHDARGLVNNLNGRTLSEVNDLLHEARQLIAGVGRLASELERDPSKLLYGDRREGYRPK
ncbi:MAG TPA: MlaD family protein [Stellaceae bacterium]|jgi:phospholipid/cholesterol/gamma-HCH transport system substrate-binding protein